MALTSNGVSVTNNDEVNSSSSDDRLPMEHEEVEHTDTPLSAITNEEQKPTPIESPSTEKVPSNTDRSKARSVSFAPTVQEYEIPSSRYSPFSSRQPVDFVDALVNSYKLEISNNSFPIIEEKKYTPKTNRTRLNPNWREHRTKHLMNKLEELSLWDREEELKATQAQHLRNQKFEQIQDRQRNHDLCLHLMRQRHESELESAVLLDPAANENTRSTIARTMNLTSPYDAYNYDLPRSPQLPKRRVRQEQEKIPNYKTPMGRYRQFETKMSNKQDKINQKLQPDWQIMRAYSPYRDSIPPTVVPLFSETYVALLSVPDLYSPYKHNQYHRDVTSRSHRSPEHASSPDYETRLRAHSNRDVRVPLKEQIDGDNNHDDDNDNYNRLRLSASPPRRATNIIASTASSLYDCSTVANTPHESRPAISNNIHQDAITRYSHDISDKILQNIFESKNGASTVPTNKRVKFIDEDHDGEENFKSSRMMHQPEIISLSATR